MKKIIATIAVIFSSLFLTAQIPDSLDSLLQALQSQYDTTWLTIQSLEQSKLNEILMLRTELETQKFLKLIFLLGFLFMTVVVIMLIVLYYTKIKHIVRIVELQDREIKLRQLEIDKLTLIVNHSNDAISIADSTGKIIWANKSFERIFGFNPEVKTANIFDTKDPDIKKLHEKAKQERKPIQYTTEMRKDNGERLWIQRKIIPFVNEKNEIINYAVIDTDYTALKLATEKK